MSITKKDVNEVDISEYAQTLFDLKKRISEAQIKAAISVNKELIKLYWSIGETLAEKQDSKKWGTKVIEQLAQDLQNSFPAMGGFSRTNVFRMKAFFLAYKTVPQAVGLIDDRPIFLIPWGHNAVLLEKLKDNKERLWYAQKTIEHGWSRSILEMKIESNLYNRQSKAITNFDRTLPPLQSDLAQQALKDPYNLKFLNLDDEHAEREIEQGLVDNMQKFLLELGKGFAFVGRQYHLEVEDEDFYTDLLFYHIKLKCYVVVELKARKFDPRDVGQLNFYLTAVDNLLKEPSDNPTIGLLLCKTKKNIIAEWALKDIKKPIGIAGYETKFTEILPKSLTSSLPTIEELEKELEKYDILIELEKKQGD